MTGSQGDACAFFQEQVLNSLEQEMMKESYRWQPFPIADPDPLSFQTPHGNTSAIIFSLFSQYLMTVMNTTYPHVSN